MRKIWIGTGWKMNKTLAEAEAYAVALRKFMENRRTDLNIFIVPPFTALKRVCDVLKGAPVTVGAQNMHWEERGAATGEISPIMIKDCGATLVELGHSERRAQFGETDFTVNMKVLSALKHGLRPLVCIGETAIEKDFDVAKEYVLRQVKIALRDVPKNRIGEVLLAYEPVWAIGESGTPAEPGYANFIQGKIREVVAESYGDQVARDFSVLYGGSVNIENAASFVKQPEVDGLFIGRAAWEADSFCKLIQAAEKGL